jgi:hypothetical protein
MSEPAERDDPEELEPVPHVPTVMDADVAPNDVAAWAASITPGSAVMTSLVALDSRRMSHEGRVDAVAALDKHLSMFHALQDRSLAVMAQDPPVPTPLGEVDKDWVREEVACALRLSHEHAANRLQVAKELTGRLPESLDLRQRGEITTHHSRSLVASHRAMAAMRLGTRRLPAVDRAWLR